MRTARVAGGLALLLLLAACAQPGAPGLPDPPAGTGSDADVADEFGRRAAEIASRWRGSGAEATWRTGLVPLESLTVLPDGPVSDAAAQAIAAGWLRTDLDLSAEPPGDGEVVFADGEVVPVPLVPLADAWDAIYGGEPMCSDEPAPPRPTPTDPEAPVGSSRRCTVLTVTDAYAGTVTLATNRGPAEVPAWLFEVEGLTAPVARVAVAPEAVAEVPRLADVDYPYQEGLAVASGLVAVGERDLTYRVGVGACDEEPAPLRYETEEVVVVGAIARLKPGTTVCTDQLLLAETSVALEAPLGRRPVLSTTGEVLAFQRW
jgi:hypothetical protein